MRLERLSAPAVFDGPIDNPTFRADVEQALVPTLQHGDVVVLDNLAVHKQPAVRDAIEQAFAKLKAFFRAARPRNFDQVCELMAAAMRLFTPSECRNYMRTKGYRVAT